MRAARAFSWGESRLARMGAALARPGRLELAALALLLAAILLRLPLVATADDVTHGHNDATVYFNQVYAHYLNGNFYPDHDRGSGWSLLLYVTLAAFDVEGGAPVWRESPLEANAARAALLAYALSAMASAGIVAATFLLAKRVLSPLATLAALAFVTFDPYLLSITTSAMSEPPYTVLLVLALACAVRVEDSPWWLVGSGVLLALAHVLRVNGLVMLVAALVVGWLGLRALAPRRRARWLGATAAVFLLVLTPYLAWRAEHVGNPFDYGTNQRFFADDLWDMDDPYWTARNAGLDPPKETLSDYLATHTIAEAVGRLYRSVQWMLFDLLGYGKWPQGEPEGGWWTGTPPDGSALTPLLSGLLVVGLFLARPWRRWAFVWVSVALTLATFVWVYPLVRSVRYFAPLIPLAAILAAGVLAQLCAGTRHPRLAGAAVVGAYAALYAARPALALPDGARLLAASGEVAALVGVFALGWALLVALPLARQVPRPRGRPARGRGDEETG